MQQRIQQTSRQALEAREKALQSGDSRLKAEWLKVAEMWDAVAAECRDIQRERERAASA